MAAEVSSVAGIDGTVTPSPEFLSLASRPLFSKVAVAADAVPSVAKRAVAFPMETITLVMERPKVPENGNPWRAVREAA